MPGLPRVYLGHVNFFADDKDQKLGDSPVQVLSLFPLLKEELPPLLFFFLP